MKMKKAHSVIVLTLTLLLLLVSCGSSGNQQADVDIASLCDRNGSHAVAISDACVSTHDEVPHWLYTGSLVPASTEVRAGGSSYQVISITKELADTPVRCGQFFIGASSVAAPTVPVSAQVDAGQIADANGCLKSMSMALGFSLEGSSPCISEPLLLMENEDTAAVFYPAYYRVWCIDSEGQNCELLFPVINDRGYADGVFATEAIEVESE